MPAQVGASGPLDAERISRFMEEVESSDSGFKTEAEMADARAEVFKYYGPNRNPNPERPKKEKKKAPPVAKKPKETKKERRRRREEEAKAKEAADEERTAAPAEASVRINTSSTGVRFCARDRTTPQADAPPPAVEPETDVGIIE